MVIDELIAILGYRVEGEEELKGFSDRLKAVQKDAEGLAQAIGKGVAVAGAALVGALSFLGKGVLDTGATFETLTVRLEGLEGSAEKAATALDWIREFAETTPLSLSEAANAYASLKNFGIDPTTGALQAAVDQMALSGQGADYLSGILLAMGQAWSKQKLQGEEALQLIERGVPVWQLLADKLGLTVAQVQKLSEQGKLGRKEMQLLFDAMGARAAGASEKAAKTWTGLIGRIGDRWEAFKKLIADGGFFEGTKKVIEDTLNRIDQWFADGRAEKLAMSLATVLGALVTATATIADRVATHLQFIVDNIETLQPYLVALGIAFGALAVAAFPVTSALIAIGLAFEDFLSYLEGGASVFGDVVKWLTDLTGISETVAATITGLGATILAALGAGLIALLPTAMGTLAATIVTALATAIGSLAGTLIGGFVTLFAALSNPVGWAVIIAGVGAALIAYFYDDIVAAAPGLMAAGAEMGNALLNGMKSIGSAIADWFAGLVPDWAKGFFGGGSGPSAPSAPTPEMQNLQGNLGAINSPAGGAGGIGADNRQYSVSVDAPVTVNVQQASQAPGAVGAAVSGAINRAGSAAPSRMQTGPSQ